MDAARKSFELSTQVRQNAEQYKNVMNDLLSWEKDMKDKEAKMQQQQPGNDNDMAQMDNKKVNAPAVRSHVQQNNAEAASNKLNGCNGQENNLDSPTEKRDTELNEQQRQRKEADEIKDRGNRFVKLGDYHKAIEEYDKAIAMCGDNPVFYSNRALCFLKLERYDECIEDCDRAIEIDNLAVKAYYRRMQANESLGNNMDALKDCTTVLMIEPKNSEANRSLDRINERLRKNVKKNGPNFSMPSANFTDILPIDKPAYKRSSKPLKRIHIADVVGPKESKNHENLQISDEDIDKLFNSNCGYFEEIKDPEIIRKSKESLELQNQQISIESAAQKKKIIAETNKKPAEPVKEEAKPSKKPANQNVEKAAGDNSFFVERPLPPPPTSTAQFYANWKELTSSQKYQYLKSIKLPQLARILGAGFDSDTLSDMIRTLHDFYMPQRDPSMADTLLEISKNKQVDILSLLMSTEERKALAEIVNSLKENNSKEVNSAAAEQIKQKFNLN